MVKSQLMKKNEKDGLRVLLTQAEEGQVEVAQADRLSNARRRRWVVAGVLTATAVLVVLAVAGATCYLLKASDGRKRFLSVADDETVTLEKLVESNSDDVHNVTLPLWIESTSNHDDLLSFLTAAGIEDDEDIAYAYEDYGEESYQDLWGESDDIWEDDYDLADTFPLLAAKESIEE